MAVKGPELDPCGTLNVILGSKMTRSEMGLDFVVTNTLLGSVSQKILISSKNEQFFCLFSGLKVEVNIKIAKC